MNDRRLVGIDLGIASAHAVRVLDGRGTTLAKRKALPTVQSCYEWQRFGSPGGVGMAGRYRRDEPLEDGSICSAVAWGSLRRLF